MGTTVITTQGIIRFAASLYGTDDDPMDATVVRDGVVQGLLHCADQMAQVRVNYMPIAAAVANGQDTYETIEADPQANVYARLATFGPWPLSLRADGSGYKLRVKLAGAMSDVTGAPTGTFRVVICPLGLEYRELYSSTDHVFQATTTSTSVAWLTGASVLSSYATYMVVTADVAAGWVRPTSVYDAVSSASPHDINQCLVAAHVFAKTDNNAKLPRLHGLYVAEFVGAT